MAAIIWTMAPVNRGKIMFKPIRIGESARHSKDLVIVVHEGEIVVVANEEKKGLLVMGKLTTTLEELEKAWGKLIFIPEL